MTLIAKLPSIHQSKIGVAVVAAASTLLCRGASEGNSVILPSIASPAAHGHALVRLRSSALSSLPKGSPSSPRGHATQDNVRVEGAFGQRQAPQLIVIVLLVAVGGQDWSTPPFAVGRGWGPRQATRVLPDARRRVKPAPRASVSPPLLEATGHPHIRRRHARAARLGQAESSHLGMPPPYALAVTTSMHLRMPTSISEGSSYSIVQ